VYLSNSYVIRVNLKERLIFISGRFWQPYTGSEDLSLFGVQAGIFDSNPVYIGSIEINSVVVSGPILRDLNGSYYMDNGFGNYTKNFHYLRKINGISYSWIDSRDGLGQLNSVFAQLPVGKITKNGDDVVGTILTNIGFIYMDESSYSWHFIRDTYQILTCTYLDVVYTTTTPYPPTDQKCIQRQPCSKLNLFRNILLVNFFFKKPLFFKNMLTVFFFKKNFDRYFLNIF